MMYTCDDTNGLQAGIPLDGTLRTINMQEDPNGNIAALRIHQPDRPVLITEYWTGWFDWWGDKHHDLGLDFTRTTRPDQTVRDTPVNHHGEF